MMLKLLDPTLTVSQRYSLVLTEPSDRPVREAPLAPQQAAALASYADPPPRRLQGWRVP